MALGMTIFALITTPPTPSPRFNRQTASLWQAGLLRLDQVWL